MNQVEPWEIVATCVGIVLLAYSFFHYFDVEDLLDRDPSTPVHMTGKLSSRVPLQSIQIVPIPQGVIDQLPQESFLTRKYFTANKKYILMVSSSTCPYARAFKNAFKYLFSTNGYNEYYHKHIFKVGGSYTISCSSADCAKMWIFRNCSNGFCIIHPQQKKAIIDSSKDAAQIARTLEKYKEW